MAIPRDADARKYYRAAKQRLEEGELVLVKLGLSAAAVYLLGYSVECILKSLVLDKTAAGDRNRTLKSLKETYGHRLSGLRVALLDRGQVMPREVLRELTYVSNNWSPNLRYEPGPGRRAEADRFLAASKVIVDWTDRRI